MVVGVKPGWVSYRVRIRIMVRVRFRVRFRVRGGVTSKEIDRTWMCDSMETRAAAPRVYPRSRETKDSALSEYDPQMAQESPCRGITITPTA